MKSDTVNTRNTVESVGMLSVDNCVNCQGKAQVAMCQLSRESTDYKMRGWMKIGFVLG